MNNKECVPFAPALIESMRSLGYSFSSAVADLLDNSISAKADTIKIFSNPGGAPFLVIYDNGTGMDEDELYEAMRYGSTNPLTERSADDLGRFGLGMKSASMSQCRKLVVVSKKNGAVSAYSWDLDYIFQTGSWMLKGFSDEQLQNLPMIDLLDSADHGTYIFLSDFDRIEVSTGNIAETFNKKMDEMIDHLSLVFHRFIEEGLSIYVNGRAVAARDPFLLSNRFTIRKREESFYIDNEKIVLKPYILPHPHHLSQEDLVSLGGVDRLREDQGFYIYRNKRLIIWGTWFRLGRKDELNNLARVMVDIPNSLDYMWSIDIKKSSASLPDIMKKNMYNAVLQTVSGSKGVHEHRGRQTKKSKDIDYVWKQIQGRDGNRYEINRELPQIELLSSSLDKNQMKLLSSLLSTIETCFPVRALYFDVAEGKAEEKKTSEVPSEEIEAVWQDFLLQLNYVKSSGLDAAVYCEALSKVEPYCKYDEIKSRILEEVKKL